MLVVVHYKSAHKQGMFLPFVLVFAIVAGSELPSLEGDVRDGDFLTSSVVSSGFKFSSLRSRELRVCRLVLFASRSTSKNLRSVVISSCS